MEEDPDTEGGRKGPLFVGNGMGNVWELEEKRGIISHKKIRL